MSELDTRDPNDPAAKKEMRQVVGASTLGTVFEWYDFFIYGTLASSGIIGATFFASENKTIQLLLAWAGFAIGFGFRPLGAAVFGYLGDKFGRKHTFLATIAIMGIATTAIGLVPSVEQIGIAAPIIVIVLRIAQGLALGGEYGGAALYVAEHSPPGRRGFFTSFIQAGVAGGFVLSLIVILATQFLVGDEIWEAWGWRIPLVFSVVLLSISLWMRVKLSESPVFEKIKKKGEIAKNPLRESFTYPGNAKRIFVALFGVAAGLTVIWYTAMFSTLSFLQSTAKLEETTAQLLVGVGAASGLVWFLLFGALSDRIGRKLPLVVGYVLTLLLLFPTFMIMGKVANPELAQAIETQPIAVSGPDCNPFGDPQESACNAILSDLLEKRIPFSRTDGPSLEVTVGNVLLKNPSPAELDMAMTQAGYDLTPRKPDLGGIVVIVFLVLLLGALSGATYGPVAALLTEMFPPHVRYSSMSIPYHVGTGYFGGFLVLISEALISWTGSPYSGLWYTWGVVLLALIVTLFGLRNPGRPPGYES